MKELVVYSKRVAEELMKQGFVLERTERNAKHPRYLVFIFIHTPEIEQAFVKLTKK